MLELSVFFSRWVTFIIERGKPFPLFLLYHPIGVFVKRHPEMIAPID